MSWIQSAKLNGHDPYCYLTDVLERLATQPARSTTAGSVTAEQLIPVDVSGSQMQHTVRV